MNVPRVVTAAIAVLVAASFAVHTLTDRPSGSIGEYCAQWHDYTRQAGSAFDLAMSAEVFAVLRDKAPSEIRGPLKDIVTAMRTIEANDRGDSETAGTEYASVVDEEIGTAIDELGRVYPEVAEFTAEHCYDGRTPEELRNDVTITDIEDALQACALNEDLQPLVGRVLDEEVAAVEGFTELATAWGSLAEELDRGDGRPRFVADQVKEIARNYGLVAQVFSDFPNLRFSSDPKGVPEDALAQVQVSLAGIDEIIGIIADPESCERHEVTMEHYRATGELVIPEVTTTTTAADPTP